MTNKEILNIVEDLKARVDIMENLLLQQSSKQQKPSNTGDVLNNADFMREWQYGEEIDK